MIIESKMFIKEQDVYKMVLGDSKQRRLRATASENRAGLHEAARHFYFSDVC